MGELGLTLIGVVVGAVLGALIGTVLYGAFTNSNMSGLVGLMFDAPIGGTVGAVVGARAARR